MRVFLDANVIFSAAKSDGAIRKLVAILTHLGHELIADEYVVQEAKRNLDAKYSSPLSNLEAVLKSVRITPGANFAFLPVEIELVEKDRPVLASAIALECDALVNGDTTHFGHLYGTKISGVEIHSPKSIAELLI